MGTIDESVRMSPDDDVIDFKDLLNSLRSKYKPLVDAQQVSKDGSGHAKASLPRRQQASIKDMFSQKLKQGADESKG